MAIRMVKKLLKKLVVIAALVYCIINIHLRIKHYRMIQDSIFSRQKTACDFTDGPRIYYNRIPRTGSQAFIEVLQFNKRWNVHIRKKKPPLTPWTLTVHNKMKFLKDFYKIEKPSIFVTPEYFFDVTEYDCPVPTCITIVREPFDRIRSQYYWTQQMASKDKTAKKQHNMTFVQCVKARHPDCVGTDIVNLQLRMLCGHHPICRKPSDAALRLAQYNVLHMYHIVGYVDRLSEMINAVELLYQRKLRGLAWYYMAKKRSLKKMFGTKYITEDDLEDAREILKPQLRYDYKLYQFVRWDFHRKYSFMLQHTWGWKKTYDKIDETPLDEKNSDLLY